MLDDQQNERRRVQGRDPRAFYQGMNEGRLAQGSMDDWVMAFRFFFAWRRFLSGCRTKLEDHQA